MSPHKPPLLLLTLAVLLLAAAVRADSVELNDGTKFVGRITQEGAADYTMDVAMEGVRVVIVVQKDRVKTLTREAVSEAALKDRVEPPPTEKAPDLSEAAASGAFLDIPIVGRLGEQVSPEAVRRALHFAANSKIRHIVFCVDSQGGDFDAASQIAKTLRAYDSKLIYHVVVRDATGLATLFPIYARTLHLLPGATMGGATIIFDPKRLKESRGRSEAMLTSDIAAHGATIASDRGLPGDVVRAMIDPQYTFALWRDGQTIRRAMQVPPNVAANQVISQPDGKGSVLTLSRDQAIALRMGKAFDGPVANLGEQIGVTGWVRGSDYGERTLTQFAQQRAQQQQAATQRFEADVRRVTDQRERLGNYLKQNLADADRWDPTNSIPLGLSDHAVLTGGRASNPIVDRCTLAIKALANAQQAVRELIQLESQATSLGLEVLYKPGQLNDLLSSIQTRGTYLERERKRQSNVIRY